MARRGNSRCARESRAASQFRDAASGAVLGQIADILTLPANNVYVVRGGARELMIPAVDQFIAEVNVDEGYLRVNMMEGL